MSLHAGDIQLPPAGPAERHGHSVAGGGLEGQRVVAAVAGRCDLYRIAKNWELLLAVARELTRSRPSDEKGWIHAGIALRKLYRVAEARAVLLEAEPIHGACAVLHFNLGCYHCLLGEMDKARERVRRACRLDAEFKQSALYDPDLNAIWGEVIP